MAQTLQERKDALKRNLMIFNSGATINSVTTGTIFNSIEMQEMFDLVNSLNETEFNALNHITILTDTDAYDTGYENGVYEAEKALKG